MVDWKKFTSNVLKIFKKDLKATTKNKIVIIALIAIIVLPSLYSILNIEACWDPYGNTKNIKFAIVNNDVNVDFNGQSLCFGNQLVDELKNNDKFDWQFVDEATAQEGILNGTYAAAIVIPSNFTKEVLSISSTNPKSAELEFIVNEKTNPVSKKMAAAAEKSIREELNSNIVEVIDVSAFSQIGALQAGLASGAGQLGSGASQMSSGASQLNAGASQVSNGAYLVSEGASIIETQADILEKYYGNNSASELARASGQLAYSSDQVASGSNQLASSSANALSTAAGALATASSSLGSASSQLEGISSLSESEVGDYFYSPVKFNENKINEVENYGSEISPFYLILSIWVGCIISCVMLKTRYLESLFTPLETYYGKMGLFLIITLLQTTVSMAISFFIDIQINNVIMYILSMYFISIVFIILIYSLISVFGNIGKAITIILLVFQISSTGGIYPIETMQPFFQIISPYMPMTYAITMIRETNLGIYWQSYLIAFGALFALLIATLLIATIIRTYYDKRAKFFEESLIDSGLF